MNSYSDTFRLFIKDLSDHLTTRDVTTIKYLYTDVLPKGYAEKINTSIALLEAMEQASLISRDNVDSLVDAFNNIPRKDLIYKLTEYKSNLESSAIATESSIDETTQEKIAEENSSCDESDESSTYKEEENNSHALPSHSRSFFEDSSMKLRVELPKVELPLKAPSSQNTVLLPPAYFTSLKTSPSQNRSKSIGESDHYKAVDINRQRSSQQVRPEEYSMAKNPHGNCVIFSNRFDKRIKLDNGNYLSLREGTERDVSSLKDTFEYLCFTVTIHRDLPAKVIIEKLQGYAQQKEQENNDCFVCCILSHGYDGGVYGNDGNIIASKQLKNIFEGDNCESLINKPKLFFIQACQGDNDGKGVKLQADAAGTGCVAQDHLGETGLDNKPQGVVFQEIIAADADILFFNATTPGNISWRDPENGSWFVQTLCNVFQRYADSWSLLEMLTKVNDNIALKKESIESGIAKQMSTIGDNTIRKKLFFFPGR